MTIGMLAFWALVITGVALLVGLFGRVGASPTAPRTPEELLAERFARGEIDEGEYTSRHAALHGRLRA